MKWENIRVKKDTKEMLDNAKKEYVRHHKEMDGAKITYNHIIKQITKYYLEN